MKKLLGCLLLLTQISGAQTNISGNLSGTLTLANSPYYVQGHIMIQPNTQLVLEPGVKLEFQNYFKLNVQGALIAKGTVTDSIIFRAKPAMANTGWWGIRWEMTQANQDSSLLEYCKISGGRATGNGDDLNGGGVFIKFFNKVRISRSSIFNNRASNGAGVELYYSSAILDKNDISNNITHGPWSSITGAGIHCDSLSSARITGNTISSNTLSFGGWGGGIGCTNSSPYIAGNIIQYNVCDPEGGGINIRANSSPTISNNIIRFNSAGNAGAIRIVEGSEPLIIGNTITQNSVNASSFSQAYGGGILVTQAGYARILNNVISLNFSTNGGGGLWILNSSPLSISGNTFHGNFTGTSGGGALLMTVQPYLSNNVFSNNRAGSGAAIYAVQARAESVYTGNLFVNNTSFQNGGAVYLESSSPRISNCTFANNLANTMPSYTTYLYGGAGLFCTSVSNPTLTNCILWGNRANSFNGHQLYLEDNASDPPILNSILEGGTNAMYTNGSVYSGTYTNNLVLDPLFASPSTGTGSNFSVSPMSWSLQANSPGLNSGQTDTSNLALPLMDLAGAMRVRGVVDRGAFESLSCGSFVPNPGFVFTGPTLSVTAAGTGIQWLNCNTGMSAISGATSTSYTPISNGSYAVNMSQFGCTGNSACFTITNVGLAEHALSRIQVFPNPTSGYLKINGISGHTEISLWDAEGKLLLHNVVQRDTNLDLQALPKGIYALKLKDVTHVRTEKIVID